MIINGYTLKEAAEILGLSHVGAKKAAQRDRWPFQKVGNVHLYHKADVLEYRDHRQRTDLVEALGWRGRGLYRNIDIDIECPVCGGFAVMWPPPPEIADRWRCGEGCEGEL